MRARVLTIAQPDGNPVFWKDLVSRVERVGQSSCLPDCGSRDVMVAGGRYLAIEYVCAMHGVHELQGS
jgi:hypothetical protein